MEKSIIYQVLPRLWKKGKFSDWKKASFDYVKSLGASYIWFTGVLRHASGQEWVKGKIGSPYAICDFYDINPYLADDEQKRMQEFENLVVRTHKAGLKVILDFVPNHVAKCGANDIPTCGFCDYDWTDTVKIDYSRSETWSKLRDIVAFWASKGVDGFRCDMIEMVPVDFLKWLVSDIRKDYPGTVFIGEAYNRQNYPVFVNEAGFDLIYDKSGYYDTLKSVMQAGMTVEAFTWNWQSLGSLQGNMLNFLENHDEQRFASDAFAGRADRCFAALAVAALFNDASFMLYFGQECGERAEESDNARTSIFDPAVVSSLSQPDEALLQRYRETLALASSPVFRKGRNWDLGYCNRQSEGFNPVYHFAFLRIADEGAALVVCNFSNFNSRMKIYIPGEAGLSSGSFEVDVPAWDYKLLPIEK